MSEEAWYKMLAVSVALHIIIIGVILDPVQIFIEKNRSVGFIFG